MCSVSRKKICCEKQMEKTWDYSWNEESDRSYSMYILILHSLRIEKWTECLMSQSVRLLLLRKFCRYMCDKARADKWRCGKLPPNSTNNPCLDVETGVASWYAAAGRRSSNVLLHSSIHSANDKSCVVALSSEVLRYCGDWLPEWLHLKFKGLSRPTSFLSSWVLEYLVNLDLSRCWSRVRKHGGKHLISWPEL